MVLLRCVLCETYPFSSLGAPKLSVVCSVIESGVVIGKAKGSVEYADEVRLGVSSD
jgi:hypothetical protein